MPTGKIERDGTVKITYNPCNGDKLLISIDMAGMQLLPCEYCERIVACELNAVSITCDDCADRYRLR